MSLEVEATAAGAAGVESKAVCRARLTETRHKQD